jgi:hypothetical protein
MQTEYLSKTFRKIATWKSEEIGGMIKKICFFGVAYAWDWLSVQSYLALWCSNFGLYYQRALKSS